MSLRGGTAALCADGLSDSFCDHEIGRHQRQHGQQHPDHVGRIAGLQLPKLLANQLRNVLVPCLQCPVLTQVGAVLGSFAVGSFGAFFAASFAPSFGGS